MISVNESGLEVFEEMMDFAEELQIGIEELDNGTTIVDAGVEETGGFEAGIYVARICMADLADIRLTNFELNEAERAEAGVLPAIVVTTDHPIIACMASQYAGWEIKKGNKFIGMGSGPARALSLKPKKLYDKIGYEDDAVEAVLVLESSKIPDKDTTVQIAKECGVEEEDLYIVVTPTSSIAGSVQISARGVETGIHKLEALGFDINTIKHAYGIIPISPIVGSDVECMGSTNDCIIYGSRTYYVVEHENEKDLKEYVKKAPSLNSKDYGKPFYKTFKEAGFNFFKIDANMFAPAVITVNEIRSGKTFTVGKINTKVLLESFGYTFL